MLTWCFTERANIAPKNSWQQVFTTFQLLLVLPQEEFNKKKKSRDGAEHGNENLSGLANFDFIEYSGIRSEHIFVIIWWTVETLHGIFTKDSERKHQPVFCKSQLLLTCQITAKCHLSSFCFDGMGWFVVLQHLKVTYNTPFCINFILELFKHSVMLEFLFGLQIFQMRCFRHL